MYQGFAQQYYSQRQRGMSFQRCSQDTQVPVSKPLSFEDMMAQQNSLKVPNGEEVPMGCEHMIPYRNSNEFFTCPDGTILEIKTGRTVLQGKSEGSDHNTWGNRMMQNPYEGMDCGEWNDREINTFNPYVSQNNPQGIHLDGKDLEYQRYSEMKNKELVDNMNEEQRRLLRNLENGEFIQKTRLIEESKKHVS